MRVCLSPEARDTRHETEYETGYETRGCDGRVFSAHTYDTTELHSRGVDRRLGTYNVRTFRNGGGGRGAPGGVARALRNLVRVGVIPFHLLLEAPETIGDVKA